MTAALRCLFRRPAPAFRCLPPLLLALAAGCASLPPPLHPAAASLRLRMEALGKPAPAQLDPAALNEEIRNWLDGRIPANWTARRKLRALHHLLFDETGLGLVYDPAATRTAVETFASRRGNCLSVTNLVIGMARHLGLDAGYQRVTLATEWDREADLMIRYEHINARGRLPDGMEYVIDFLPQLALKAGGEAELVDASLGRALYFSNLGVEALLQEDADLALARLRLAVAIRPDLADAWVNLGTVFRRRQRPDLAEYGYREALRLDGGHQTALGNLANLYQQLGETEAAAGFHRRLARVRGRNPYYHFEHWRRDFEAGRFRESLAHLARALARKQEEPDFHQARAETLVRLGRLPAAGGALARADELRAALAVAPKERAARLLLYDNPDEGVTLRISTGGLRLEREP